MPVLRTVLLAAALPGSVAARGTRVSASCPSPLAADTSRSAPVDPGVPEAPPAEALLPGTASADGLAPSVDDGWATAAAAAGAGTCGAFARGAAGACWAAWSSGAAWDCRVSGAACVVAAPAGTGAVADGPAGLPEGNGRGRSGSGTGGRVTAGAVSVRALDVGATVAVAVGAAVAVAAAVRDACTAGTSDAGTETTAGAAVRGRVALAVAVSRGSPGSLAAPELTARDTLTGREPASSVADAVVSAGSAVPWSAWDACAPVVRTSTAPTAAAAALRRIPPWIPVRTLKARTCVEPWSSTLTKAGRERKVCDRRRYRRGRAPKL